MKISASFYLGKVFIDCISLKTISHVYPAVFPALKQVLLNSAHNICSHKFAHGAGRGGKRGRV
jgi:hypothetical protein